ncbi:hypothetical protein C8A00DRAFT_35828 [Chaetomidium leptoderma]|uniref:Uncharacterized protein n=1 Tax=Chaetomidium leptoderma TaxID=669021 RepID=A0AAN6VJV5_9PEZI|nr:hypothetical protein C8A00DRAFT_35828 [Chaetomidium leptoderma]
MSQSDNQETPSKVKTLLLRYQVLKKEVEHFWPAILAEEVKVGKDKVVAVTKQAIDGLTAITLAAADKHRAEGLPGKSPTVEDLTGELVGEIIKYLQETYGPIIPPVVLDPEPIVIGSDTDDDAGREADHHGGRGRILRAKRTHDSGLDAPCSRPKRTRRTHCHDGTSGPDAVEIEKLRKANYIPIVDMGIVENKDFVFPYPAVGPGYFVLWCARARFKHRFTEDPFLDNRAIKHFERVAPDSKCHKRDDAKTYKPEDGEELVRKFGWRVVNSNGGNVESDWVEANNARLAEEMEEGLIDSRRLAESKKLAESRAKEKQSASTMPPVRFSPAHRRMGEPAAAIWPEPAAAAGPEATQATQAVDVGNVDLTQQEEDFEAMMTRVVSDILLEEQ